MTFHGKERFRDRHSRGTSHGHDASMPTATPRARTPGDAARTGTTTKHGPVEPHESPWVVTLPLILLWRFRRC